MNKQAKLNQKLAEQIADEIRKFKIVRKARILASERLGGYANKWDLYLLLMAILSSALLVVSLTLKDEGTARKVVSGCFSMYTVIIQYYVSTLNYRERALKFHYHHIEINKLKQELVSLNSLKASNRWRTFKVIMDKYDMLLQQQENHSELDYYGAKGMDSKFTRDFSLDNIFVNIQPLIIIGFVLAYILVGGM